MKRFVTVILSVLMLVICSYISISAHEAEPNEDELIEAEHDSIAPKYETNDSGNCRTCGGTYRYTLEYEQSGDTYHCVRHWCSKCGNDQFEGTNIEHHTMSNGECIYCGYSDGTGSCTHSSTSKEWSGCYWEEHCSRCYTPLDSGYNHGSYKYTDWEYYSSTRHMRKYACVKCGEGTNEYGDHSTEIRYSQYTDTQHSKAQYCSVCSSTVGTASYENHSIAYGSYSDYDNDTHRRQKSCRTCGYSGYDYEAHSDTNKDGICDGCSRAMGVRIEWNCVRNGGTVNGAGTISTTAAVGSAAVPPESVPVKKGHEFSGWYTAPDGDTIYSDVLIEGETTFYAQFIPKEYTIVWDYGDGQGEATLQKYGSQIVLPEKPVKKGYAFKGWYTEDGVKITGDETYMKDDDSIYFARWEQAEIFSVTVPLSLLITVSEHGNVYSAANAEISNNSTGAVRVTSITVSGDSGWRIVPYDCSMASEKVDSKEIGFKLNGASTESRGSLETLTLGGNWTIDEGESLQLAYDAVVSAMSEAVSEQVLTIVFVVEWAE